MSKGHEQATAQTKPSAQPADAAEERIDSIRLDFNDPKVRVEKLDNGMVRIHNPVVSRAGVFIYRNPDGSMRREFRPPEEVFNRESMDSFAGMPVTIHHPRVRTADGLLDAKTVKPYIHGALGDRLYRDGNFLRASMITLHTADATQAYHRGLDSVSLGYKQKAVIGPGRFDGVDYMATQTRIRGNHVALVPRGNAGDVARLPRFDQAPHSMGDNMAFVLEQGGSFQVRRGDPDWEVVGTFDSRAEAEAEVERLHRRNNPRAAARGESALRRYREAQRQSSREDGNMSDKQSGGDARMDAMDELVARLRGDIQRLTTEKETLQGLLDEANQVRQDAADIDERVAAEVKARFDLAAKWRNVLPDSFEAHTKTPDEIKRAVIAAAVPSLAEAAARYDSAQLDHSLTMIEGSALALEAEKRKRQSTLSGLNNVSAAAAQGGARNDGMPDVVKARKAYISARFNGKTLGPVGRFDGGASR